MSLPSPLPLEIDVATLDQARRQGVDLVLLDVREPHEWAICGFADAVRVPLGQLAARTEDLPRDRPLVVCCRSGARSLAAVRHLRANGFAAATNLKGGVLAWAAEIDPSWPSY